MDDKQSLHVSVLSLLKKTGAALASLVLTSQAFATITPGVMPGEFSVSESGSANYQIPIAVPPGTSGMQPSLSLSYNSNSGNGVLGMGWTLGGLSVITRCPATKVQDGFIDGIDFDANDRFCIDGQRLIAVNGTYGANATEYRTEQDGFTKVTSYGSQASGPEYFIAQTKSGQILQYGKSTDSRIEAQGKSDVRLWAVNKISDTVSNYLTVTYNENNADGSYTPTTIYYTGNDNSSLTPNAKIEFEYEARADETTAYFSGSMVKATQRLTNIKTYVDTTLVRDYQLTYDNQGAANRSRLTQLQECEATGTCFPATKFDWLNEIDGSFKHTAISGGSGSSATKFYFGEFNGDGLTDYVYWNTTAAADTAAFQTYLAQGDGTFEHVATSGGSGSSATKFYFGEFNGDGLTDYVFWNTGAVSGQFQTYLAQGESTASKLNTITTGLNTTTGLEYKSLTDNAIYTKGTGASYPEVDLQGVMYVVSKASVSDGVGGMRDTTYKYEGLRSSVLRGSLGFSAMTSTDELLGMTTRTEYSQTYPFTGQVVSSVQSFDNDTPATSDDIVLSEVDSSFDSIITHTGTETVSTHTGTVFVYADSLTKKNYKLDGTLVSTVTTSNSYDNFGNPTTLVVDTSGLDYEGVMETYTTATTNTYTNDETNWFLGRLTRADVTQTLPTGESATRSSAFNYDASTGLLVQEVVEPDSSTLKLITDYIYDLFGNKTAVTVSN